VLLPAGYNFDDFYWEPRHAANAEALVEEHDDDRVALA